MFLGQIVRMGGFAPSGMSKIFLLLLVSLLSRAESNCKDSKPFYIKNRSTKTTRAYLTVDEDTRSVNGAAKTGKPDQQWKWRECEGPRPNKDIVNVATGECLSIKGKRAKVSTRCNGKYNWIYGQTYGTLELFLKNKRTWLRLVKKKAAVKTSKVKYLKGTDQPMDWFRWDLEDVPVPTSAPTNAPTSAPTSAPTTASTSVPPYKQQPEDPGCYTSTCPPGCQLVLISKLKNPLGGLYYGIPALESHIAVSPNTKLYKSTGQSAVGATGDWASTYYLFHHVQLNMWVIGKGEDALTNLWSLNVLAESGNSGSFVVPAEEGHQWTWEGISPICFDDNKCSLSLPDQTSRSLMHQSYPFSEKRDGRIVTQFTYKGDTYEATGRTDSEGALIFANRGIPMDIPISGRNNQETPERFRVFSFSERDGFQDVEDFDPSIAVTDRLNDDRHLQTSAIHGGISIPATSGLSWSKTQTGSATSWELRMDITVTHSANGTFFKTVGWQPGGYSGIQQKPDTRIAPSGKNFIFSMWDTNTDNWGNAEGGVPSYSYVDELNENADLGGKLGPAPKPFSGEGTGQQIQVDYPWAIGDTTTIIIRGSRASVDSEEWCVTSGLTRPDKEEVFLARFCRKSPEDVLLGWGFSVFIEDWLGFVNCNYVGYDTETKWMNFKKQRAAVFSNWKVVVDGKEVTTAAPRFKVNQGHARGLSDAGMLGDNAFFISTGGWRYDSYVPQA